MGGGEWNWVEMSARFSNTRLVCYKVIETITYIKSVSEKKITIDIIHAHLYKSADVDEV